MATRKNNHSRISQPQDVAEIDWSNPITLGLEFVGLACDGGIQLFKSGRVAFQTVASRPGRAGQGNYTSGSAITTTGATGVTGANYSLLSFGTSPSSGSNRSSIDDDLDTSSPRCFQFRLNNANKVELITFDTGGNPYFATAASALSSAQMAEAVVMGAVVAGNSIASFQNGVKASASASGSQRVPTGDFYIGQHKGFGTQAWDGDLFVTATWARALADDEMYALSSNPWMLFVEDQFAPFTTSAPPTFLAAWAHRQTRTIGAGVI